MITVLLSLLLAVAATEEAPFGEPAVEEVSTDSPPLGDPSPRKTDGQSRPPVLARLVYEIHDDLRGCPGEREIKAAVTARLGEDPWGSDPSHEVHITVRPTEGGVTAHVSLRAEDGAILGERSIGGLASCADLPDPVGLVVAMALDPLLLLEGRSAAPSPPAAAPRESEEPRPLAPIVFLNPVGEPAGENGGGATDTARSPVALSPSASTGLALGFAPRATFSAALGLRASLARASLSVEARADMPAGAPAGSGSFSTAILLLQAAPCIGGGRLELCAVGGAGVIRLTGRDLDSPEAPTRPYFVAGSRMLFTIWRGERAGLALRLEGVAPLVRVSAVDSTSGSTYWRAPPVAGTVGLSFIPASRS